jgi:hypothetical protein
MKWLLLLLTLPWGLFADVTLQKSNEGLMRFHVDGKPFFVKGGGGANLPGLMEKLAAAGGNTLRTWGIETLEQDMGDGETYLERAHRLGLKVIPGIWIQHERHGFDYGDPDFIAAQRQSVREIVRRYKDHPAILAWGLGNEMEGPASREGSVTVFKEMENLIQIVKEEDPDHPVVMTIAFSPDKVRNVMKHVPSVDVLGINSYGAAASAGSAMAGMGWDKPFMVMEFGVRGFWEVPKTEWGAPLEPDSHEKARTYYATHRLVAELNDGHELCLGTFPFLWGWKQERTYSWFGMFLSSGEKLGSVDAMTKLWTGDWPENRCPRIRSLTSEAAASTLSANRLFTARAEVTDPEDDALAYTWILKEESQEKSEGGDAEKVPEVFPDYTDGQNGPVFTLPKPLPPGEYRLYLEVRDGQGSAATANFPFKVIP